MRRSTGSAGWSPLRSGSGGSSRCSTCPTACTARDVAEWRSALSSSYAAAYHPWLGTVPEGRERPGGAGLRRLAPSAVAAGIIAGRERRLGIPWGPADEVAVDAVRAARDLADAEHAELFEMGVNVFRAERDGFRLTSARTLSRDPDYRQLSVRRLMTMLRLTLERQGQRLAFEPNTADLAPRAHLAGDDAAA